ncbi:glycosyltransferase family 4 protein [Chloroflexota bacterium]
MRNIRDVVPEVEYIPVPDLVGCVNVFTKRVNAKLNRDLISTFDWNNQFNDFNLNRIDVLHLFNGISYARTPWITTFETLVPRFRAALHPQENSARADQKVRRGLSHLAGHACRKIISMSDCSVGFERNLLSRYPQYKEEIEKKLVVLHPGQPVIVKNYQQKPISKPGKVRFIFVGSAFFRKGGKEIVDVLQSLRAKHHYDFELILISSFKIENYATFENAEDVRMYKALVRENSEWITHYSYLPNNEVLELIKSAHVGLLPTHADTYGYSLLEFQAAGCPVISTNVRALSEINNDSIGWLIKVPKNQLGEAIYSTREDRKKLSSSISTGLEEAVHEIFSDPTIIRTKGSRALERIRIEHSPKDRAERLRQIYKEIIQ